MVDNQPSMRPQSNITRQWHPFDTRRLIRNARKCEAILWGSLLPLLSRRSPKNYPRDLEHPWEKGCIYDGKKSISSGKIRLNGGKFLLILGKSDPVYINSKYLDFTAVFIALSQVLHPSLSGRCVMLSLLCHKCYGLPY